MKSKKQRILFYIALVLLLFGIAALIYVWLPSQTLLDTFPVTPTILVPPAGVP